MRGRRFERLFVLDEQPFYREETGYIAWKCLCSCGKTCIVEARHLKSMHTRSCGCLNTDTRKHFGKTKLFRLGSDASRLYDDRIIGCRYSTYRQSARAFNRDFELTYEEFKHLVLSKCHYCLNPPEERVYVIEGKIYKRGLNGVDRVDNDQGYISGNVVPCCKSCNSRKNARSVGYLLNRNAELGLAT